MELQIQEFVKSQWIVQHFILQINLLNYVFKIVLQLKLLMQIMELKNAKKIVQ